MGYTVFSTMDDDGEHGSGLTLPEAFTRFMAFASRDYAFGRFNGDIGADLREVPDLVSRMFERKGADGTGLRSLRNNLIFIVADKSKVIEMKRAIVRRLALQELKRPERVKELAEHQQAKVFELEKKSDTEAAIAIQQCYRYILYPSCNALGGVGSVQLAHSVIDIQNASERPGSGQLQVVRQLQSQNKLRDASDSPDSPSYIRDRTPLKKRQMTTAIFGMNSAATRRWQSFFPMTYFGRLYARAFGDLPTLRLVRLE